jgi:hypothetical protein
VLHVHPFIIQRRERGHRPNPTSCVLCAICRAFGKEYGSSTLLAPNLLTRGKRTDLMIYGNIVVNRGNISGGRCTSRATLYVQGEGTARRTCCGQPEEGPPGSYHYRGGPPLCIMSFTGTLSFLGFRPRDVETRETAIGGSRVDFPGKHCGSCAGLGHQ